MKTVILLLLIFECSFSQWSTSTKADSSLYVCPGFDHTLVTFDDGSSIVLGMLNSYIFAQKLDPNGFKMWSAPVMIFHNDTSDMGIETLDDRRWCCSDGDGGAILLWQDYRGAYYYTDGPHNNSIYLQRVDRFGNIKWGIGGVKVNDVIDGYKYGRITQDGSGGCVLVWTEDGYSYPNAPQKSNIWIARFNSKGFKLWSQKLDSASSTNKHFYAYDVTRCGKYYYVRYGNFYGNYGKMINEFGELTSIKSLPTIGIAASSDGKNVFLDDYQSSDFTEKVSKINQDGDTLWTRVVYWGDRTMDAGGPLVADNRGGTYLMYIFHDSLMYFDSSGSFSYKKFSGITVAGVLNPGGTYYRDGAGGLIAASINAAKRFDSTGKAVWKDSVVFFSDPENAYWQFYAPDNNGGLIITFWSTIGGIYAQHTGRTGKLGFITKVPDFADSPTQFQLLQNYPNPFNPSTKITFDISNTSITTLKIFDILGRELTTLAAEELKPGHYSLTWQGLDYSTGVYFYQLRSGTFLATKKMLLRK